ncbi:unnamed protein product [Orchesella dallaii]|uniref:Uncharacterized protein n=1 Tax=Orchesella dallaii TaxID=48710 RepID=A0ABP1QSM0_9HEXA
MGSKSTGTNRAKMSENMDTDKDFDTTAEEVEAITNMTTDEIIRKYLPVLPKIEKKIEKITTVLKSNTREICKLPMKLQFRSDPCCSDPVKLVFRCITESATESTDNLHAKMTTFLREKLNVQAVIDTAFRIGPKSDKTRLIKVRFQTMKDRTVVWEKRKLLKHPEYIKEDLHKTTRIARRELIKAAEDEEKN